MSELFQHHLCINPQILNIGGLILNIGGVILLFIHGMPPKYNEGYTEIISKNDYKNSKKWSKWALILIFLGFVLQMLSSIMQF